MKRPRQRQGERQGQRLQPGRLARLDQRHVWHPFTQMRDWMREEPIVVVGGRGARLKDARGRSYLDANSSIWTNLHGHRHPRLDAAMQAQLRRIAHSSSLGLANEPAALLARELVQAANPPARRGLVPPAVVALALSRVFFSDDGSTAMEVALKLAYEFGRRTRGLKHPRFLSLQGAYHGDTVGAVSVGHIDLFHRAYAGLLFKSDRVMAPYCYRCPFNRAKPERADAREYRRCGWECVGQVERRLAVKQKTGEPYAALVVEPRLQGAAGMIAQPTGWLREVAALARAHGALIIADEVMTGFGRTGVGWSGEPPTPAQAVAGRRRRASLFASPQEGVQPDFLVLAKGLTGGYLPMAATLTTESVFSAFLGRYEEFKTFFHGHSYTGNQLGAAVARGSLELLRSPQSIAARASLELGMTRELQSLWGLAGVGDIRQVGLVAGIELVEDWPTRKPYPLRARAGMRVCAAMARRGVLTRPIGNVLVLMPPYCTTAAQLRRMVGAMGEAIEEVLG